MSLSTNPTSALLRKGVLGIAGLTTLGITIELAIERHWTQPVQLIAWAAVGALAVAIVLMTWAPHRARVRVAQLLAGLVVLSSAVGVGEHVFANYDAGSLDQRYAKTWDSLSEPARWWLAISKTVGPSPPFAPGALAEAGLAVLLTTVGHPALASEDTPLASARGRLP